MLLWILDPAGRDATVLRQAFTGDAVDLRAATEVICSRTPSQIQTIKHIYHMRFGVQLEHDIHYHTSGDHQKVIAKYMITIFFYYELYFFDMSIPFMSKFCQQWFLFEYAKHHILLVSA